MTVLRVVVNDYTREAGVRQLEREIGTLLRKTAASVASATAAKPVVIDEPFVRQALGRAEGLPRSRGAHGDAGRGDGARRHRRRRRRPLRRGGDDGRHGADSCSPVSWAT